MGKRLAPMRASAGRHAWSSIWPPEGYQAGRQRPISKRKLRLELMRAHLGAQAGYRLAVQLANARLCDVEHGSNFFEVHVLFVVHAHDELFPLRQILDGSDQSLAQAL